MIGALPPSISFVVPCYNEADTVAEIRSGASARPREYEIILVDDHSTDRTGEVTRLTAAGRPKKVALIAAARKLPTILNAMLRDQRPWQPA